MSQRICRYERGGCARFAWLSVAITLLVVPLAQANDGTERNAIQGPSFALVADSARVEQQLAANAKRSPELVVVTKIWNRPQNKALGSSNTDRGKEPSWPLPTPMVVSAKQMRASKHMGNVVTGGNTSHRQSGASGVDEDSRMAMTAAGVVFGLGGLAGIGVGLLPWMQNQRAVQDGKAAIAAGPSAFPAYQAAEETVAQARLDGDRWGVLALSIGGGAFGFGMLMVISSALLVPEGGVE